MLAVCIYANSVCGFGNLRPFEGALFWINFFAVLCRLLDKNEGQVVPGLGHHVTTTARDLLSYTARILRDHFAEAVALDRDLLLDLNLAVDPDQMLDNLPVGRNDRCGAAADKGLDILGVVRFSLTDLRNGRVTLTFADGRETLPQVKVADDGRYAGNDVEL